MNRSLQQQGMTLIELLIALALALVVVTTVFTLVRNSIQLYNTDQSRVGANQSARSTLDILGSDIRQAGERLGADFPAILIEEDGSKNAILTLRRGLASAPLPLCSVLPTNGNPYVTAYSPAQVTFTDRTSNLPDACGSTVLNLSEWDALIDQPDKNAVFVYDASNKSGTFSTATGTRTNPATREQQVLLTSLPTFNPTRASLRDPLKDMRLYLLEERRYSVAKGQLLLSVNHQEAAPAAPQVVRLQVQPYIKDVSNTPVATPLPFPNGKLTWKDLAYLDVTLVVQETLSGKTIQRTVAERYTPRNTGSTH